MLTKNTHPFEGALEVAAALADAHINAELLEMKRRAEMERAIRELTRLGVSVDEISARTGWTVPQITSALAREQHGFDLDQIAGNR